jgi:hypothetical protein
MEIIDTIHSPKLMELPWFRVERTGDQGKLCELMTCYPSAPATHKVTFKDNGVEVLICDRHAIGIVALGEYVTRTVR